MASFKLNDVFAARYVLVEQIGEGNSLEVWLARDHLADDAVVVLKIYVGDGLDDKGLARLRQEFSLSQHLSHPHLLKVYHFDIYEGAAYLVMPFCPMGTLKDLVAEEAPLTERQVALILSQIGSALEQLHSQDPPIRHGHVEPGNILLSQPEFFLLGDYGAGSLSRFSSYSTTGARPVPTAYAPPEAFDRNQHPDVSGDVFSLGVTLFEAITKDLPWEESRSIILLKGGIVPNLPEQYSRELNELLQACLSADRGKRPTAGELHLRAKNFLEKESWSLPEDVNENGGRIKRLFPYALATVIFVLFMIGAFWEYKNGDLAAPEGSLQKMATSAEQEEGVDEMLLEMLEVERNDLSRRAIELERKNKLLAHNDSINKIMLKNQQRLINEIQGQQQPEKSQSKEMEKPESKKVVTAVPAPRKEKVVEKEKVVHLSPGEIEKQLNKISDPGIQGTARAAWKEETMARFSDGTVRILDETDGTSKQYSASIFLNLLYNVPHTIVVKEVKTDQNKKVTELRLTMQAKM